jgi:hypothetical protein
VQDWHAKCRTNIIGALIGKLLLTFGAFTNNINANFFSAWTVQDLIPKLSEYSVIIMDNATFHKRQDINDPILKAGHVLEFLPA